MSEYEVDSNSPGMQLVDGKLIIRLQDVTKKDVCKRKKKRKNTHYDRHHHVSGSIHAKALSCLSVKA